MKPLVYALAGAGVLVALAAGPVAGQGRPTGSPGGATAAPGGSGAHGGGGPGGGGGNVGGNVGGNAGSSGGGHAMVPGVSSGGSHATYGPASSYGSSGSSGATPRGTAWLTNPVNGSSPIVRQMYGAPGDGAVPRGSRPSATTPYVGLTIGHAIPRDPSTSSRPNRRPHGSGGDINWGYAPWIFSGLGFYNVLYADPLWLTGYFFPYDYGYDYDPGWDPTQAGGDGYYGNEPAAMGGLKLKVEPKDADVYIDGNLMGVVDDFNGVFQRMQLEAGPHHVELRAPGFRTIAFDVRIEPNDTVTYRGDLQPLSKR
jgi:hypothetical protein